MSLLPCFSVDPDLSESLAELDRDFNGVEIEVGGPSDTSDSDLSVPCLSSSDESENDDAEHYLDREIAADAAAALYFDGKQAPAAEPVPQAAAAAAQPTTTQNCGCDKNCLSKFDAGEVEQMQLNLAEMKKSEVDLLILGLLESSKYSVDTTAHGNKRKKQWFNYTFHGESICAGGFRCLYGVGTKQLKNLKKHLEENGPVPRTHGNAGKRPKHALSLTVVTGVAQFLKNYTEQVGIPHPAPMRGRAGTPPTFLPATFTIVSIHKLYVASCAASGMQAVGYHSFRSVWRECLPHICIMSPRTGVCSHCEAFRRRIHEAQGKERKRTGEGNPCSSSHVRLRETWCSEHQVITGR